MQLPGTSRAYVFIPVTGPLGTDLTGLTAEVALVPDAGTEPADADHHAAQWLAPDTGAVKQVALLVGRDGVGGALPYADGDYMAFARLTAGSEKPVMLAGRVRVGNPA